LVVGSTQYQPIDLTNVLSRPVEIAARKRYVVCRF
jgi:hypothetical protein